MKKVTFSNGKTETVYAVPGMMLLDIAALPRHQVEAGDTAEIVLEKEKKAARAREDAAYLAAFADTVVPEGWQFPAFARRQGVEPREGEDGRKVDYIRYELLKTAGDIAQAEQAMGGLTQEEVEGVMAFFRPCRLARWCPFARRRRKS
jgi:hypothetical protein